MGLHQLVLIAGDRAPDVISPLSDIEMANIFRHMVTILPRLNIKGEHGFRVHVPLFSSRRMSLLLSIRVGDKVKNIGRVQFFSVMRTSPPAQMPPNSTDGDVFPSISAQHFVMHSLYWLNPCIPGKSPA